MPSRSSDTAGSETELKLAADPHTLKLLTSAPALTRYAPRQGVVQRLEATYYDTKDHAIARQGASFRVRRSGRRFIQTLKLPSGDDPLKRQELESPVADLLPRPGELPADDIGALADTLCSEPLSPVFSTKIRRFQQPLIIADTEIEVAFDEGTLFTDGRTEAVCEIELELKSGEAGALYDLAISLMEIAPLRIGTESKAERGYRLSSGAAPAARKAGASNIVRSDTVDEALAKIFADGMRQAMINLAAAERGEGPDGVHQLRVALRRLRSAISAFKKEVPAALLETFNQEAKRLAAALGAARSWDVFEATTIGAIESADLDGVDFAALKSAVAPLRARDYAAARADLKDAECTRFLLALGRAVSRRSWRSEIDVAALEVLTRPASEFAARALTRLYKKALKQGRHLKRLDPAARHELRITLKKLRYNAEYFLPLFPGSGSDKFLRRLSKMQDALGADHDVATTHVLLEKIMETASGPDVDRAVGAVIGWQGHENLGVGKRLKRHWRRFLSERPFWN